MRSSYNEELKEICHKLIVDTRKSNNLSQAKMAGILLMDVRSYSDIDTGKRCCGLMTFVIFLVTFEVDYDELFAEIKASFEKVRTVGAA